MLPDTMRTIELKEHGAPDVLKAGTRPLPEYKKDQVLLKTTAAGVNGPDIMQRKGLYPPPKGASDLMGLEVSGEVVAVGDAVTEWKPGDRVCALTNGGGYAEFVAINADHCLPIPTGVSELDAAGLPETYFTVWSNLFLDHEVRSGSILLIHGGAGGIGTTAIQLGCLLGLRVFTTCSSPENAQFCVDLGAERAINYKEEDFVEILREAGGADLIVDIVGADYIGRNIKASAMDARIVQLAFRQGSKVDVDLMPIMLKRLTLTGSTLRPRPPEFKARVAADLAKRVWPHFADKTLKPLTHAVLSFENVVAAHEMMEDARHKGKILITPTQSSS